MSHNLSFFVLLSPKFFVLVMIVDMPIAGIGSFDTYYLSFHNIYHIYSLTLNLVSVTQLFESGYLFFFFPLLV